MPVAFLPSNPALPVLPRSAWHSPFLLQTDPFSRLSKHLTIPGGLSDRAGVGRWRAAKFSDDPVSPSDCGWEGGSAGRVVIDGHRLLLFLHGSNAWFIVEIISALMTCAFMTTKVVI